MMKEAAPVWSPSKELLASGSTRQAPTLRGSPSVSVGLKEKQDLFGCPRDTRNESFSLVIGVGGDWGPSMCACVRACVRPCVFLVRACACWHAPSRGARVGAGVGTVSGTVGSAVSCSVLWV